jgi:hypothetical protein
MFKIGARGIARKIIKFQKGKPSQSVGGDVRAAGEHHKEDAFNLTNPLDASYCEFESDLRARGE